MSVADRAAVLRPYAQHLLDNEDVQANLQRAVAASRDAYGRLRKKKSKAQAAQDRKIQRRALEAAQAARKVVLTLSAERQRQQRKRRGRVGVRVAVGLVGAGVGLAVVPQVRGRVLARLRADASSPAAAQ